MTITMVWLIKNCQGHDAKHKPRLMTSNANTNRSTDKNLVFWVIMCGHVLDASSLKGSTDRSMTGLSMRPEETGVWEQEVATF